MINEYGWNQHGSTYTRLLGLGMLLHVEWIPGEKRFHLTANGTVIATAEKAATLFEAVNAREQQFFDAIVAKQISMGVQWETLWNGDVAFTPGKCLIPAKLFPVGAHVPNYGYWHQGYIVIVGQWIHAEKGEPVVWELDGAKAWIEANWERIVRALYKVKEC